jgi:hypothetical protein
LAIFSPVPAWAGALERERAPELVERLLRDVWLLARLALERGRLLVEEARLVVDELFALEPFLVLEALPLEVRLFELPLVDLPLELLLVERVRVWAILLAFLLASLPINRSNCVYPSLRQQTPAIGRPRRPA